MQEKQGCTGIYIYLHKTQVAPSGPKNNCGATVQTH